MKCRTQPRYVPLVSIAIAVLNMAAPCCAQDAAAGKVNRYQLVDEWSVAAQGPVHLREKQVKAAWRIEVSEMDAEADSGRRLQVRFIDVAVDANIPAQRRKGRFDSKYPPAELKIESHELVRFIALWRQTLQLKFSADGVLSEVDGIDAAARRLDEMYDQHLRGSGQDLYTRDIERQRISSEALRRDWAGVFIAQDADRAPAAEPQMRTATARFLACIPSESWMKQIVVPVAETVRVSSRAEGGVEVRKTATLAESKMVGATIGDAPFSYQPETLKRETTVQVRPDGSIEQMESSLTAVLATTLSIGTDIPIRMTIQHTTTLSPQ